jgi:hypothetical protein
MDLALYAIEAVLFEGVTRREVAGATGRSKSWLHRHVPLHRGEAALAPKHRGPKIAPDATASPSWPPRSVTTGLTEVDA